MRELDPSTPLIATFDQPHASADGGAILLKAAEARLRNITNTVPGVVYQCEVAGEDVRFTFISERIREVRGLGRKQVLANPYVITDQMLPEDRDRVHHDVLEAARLQRAYSSEYRIRMDEGEVRWIRTEMIPAQELSPTGATVFTGMWFDVTQIKEADARLEWTRDSSRAVQA